MTSRSLLVAAALAATALIPAVASAAQVAPDVEKFKMAPPSFKALATGPEIVTVGGAPVTFRLRDGAFVNFTVKAEKPGKKSGGKCVTGKPKAKSAACVRTVDIPGAFKLVGITGDNEFRFSGRIADKRLVPGRYRLIAKAEGTAARSSFVPFKIIK